MRVGILTFPNSPSFGASLQMCGLYHALEAIGADVEIINYKNTFMAEKKHMTPRKSFVFKNQIVSVLDIPGKRKFQEFESKLRFFPVNCLCEKDDLEAVEERFDYLICGSDQVWNPDVTGEDMNYFFVFCRDNSKKVSYAASFGVSELSPRFSARVKEQLQWFSSISVREEQGAEIVKNLLGRECQVVLDPSMLLRQKEWKKMERQVKGLPPRYIARFLFNHDENTERQILMLQEKTKLPVVTIGGTVISKLKKGHFTGPIGPEEWLYIIDHADYVVTDSFHGTAFSIIFHKRFYVSLASRTNSRLKNLLHTFALEDRLIDGELSDEEIDYQRVQTRMDEKRDDSVTFLKKAMGIGD